MLLWDREMAPFEPRLEPLSPAQRLALAVSAITWTLDTLPSPIETEAVQAWLDQALVVCRQAVEDRAVYADLPDDLDSTYETVDEEADEPGTSHFLSAVFACTEDSDGLGSDELYGVLSYCYEGSLDREGIPVWTIEAEEANRRCRTVIEHQQQLITQAAQ